MRATVVSAALLALLGLLVVAVSGPARADHVAEDDITWHVVCKDCIPAITDPTFTKEHYLADGERVLGVEVNGDARAYPLKVMNYHEIVDDTVGGQPLAVTYCPLCRTGLVFDRRLGGETLTFKVSGSLYRNNLLMYDTATDSLWAQAWGQAVWGERHGAELDLVSSQTTTFGAWRQAHPQTLVMELPTRYDRDYDRDPYAGYDRTGETLVATGYDTPDLLHPKALVLGIAGETGGIAPGAKAVAWSFELLARDKVVMGEVGQTRLVLTHAGDSVQAFRAGDRTFEPAPGQPGVMRDDQGRRHDAFTGRSLASDAPPLEQVPADTPFWFSWFDFHPGTGLHHVDGFHTFQTEEAGQDSGGIDLLAVAIYVGGPAAAIGIGAWYWRSELR